MFKSDAQKIVATARKRGLKASFGKEGKSHYVKIGNQKTFGYMTGIQMSYTQWINKKVTGR